MKWQSDEGRERDCEMARIYNTGSITLAELGLAHGGLSRERVRQAVCRGEREIERRKQYRSLRYFLR